MASVELVFKLDDGQEFLIRGYPGGGFVTSNGTEASASRCAWSPTARSPRK